MVFVIKYEGCRKMLHRIVRSAENICWSAYKAKGCILRCTLFNYPIENLILSDCPFPHFLPGDFFTIEKDTRAVDLCGHPGSADETEDEQEHAYDQFPGAETIRDTVSYEDLFAIVKKRMQTPTPLLEKVCEAIISSVRQQFTEVQEVAVSIYKLQPPIENLQGKVGVTMRKKFNV